MDELKHEIIRRILTLGNRGRPDFHLFVKDMELSDLQNKLIATNCTGKVSSNSIVLLTSPQYIPTLQSIIEKMDQSLSRRYPNLIDLSSFPSPAPLFLGTNCNNCISFLLII